jgi:hypothetical protein
MYKLQPFACKALSIDPKDLVLLRDKDKGDILAIGEEFIVDIDEFLGVDGIDGIFHFLKIIIRDYIKK